jgi:MFS family permease
MLAVLAALLAVVFAVLAQEGKPARRWLIAVGIALVGLAAAAALAGLVVGTFGCYEDCDDRSNSWTEDPDAWQWTFVIVLPALGLGGTMAATYAAMRSHFRRAQLAILVAAMFLGAWIPLATHGGGISGI